MQVEDREERKIEEELNVEAVQASPVQVCFELSEQPLSALGSLLAPVQAGMNHDQEDVEIDHVQRESNVREEVQRLNVCLLKIDTEGIHFGPIIDFLIKEIGVYNIEGSHLDCSFNDHAGVGGKLESFKHGQVHYYLSTIYHAPKTVQRGIHQ